MSAEVGLDMLLEQSRPAWQARGSCRGGAGHEPFFPTRGKGVEEARRVCAGCEVRSECLGYALEHGIRHGVWGGTSEAERRRIRRRQGAPGSTQLAVARLARQGARPPQIAEQLGVTTRTVYRHLQRGAA